MVIKLRRQVRLVFFSFATIAKIIARMNQQRGTSILSLYLTIWMSLFFNSNTYTIVLPFCLTEQGNMATRQHAQKTYHDYTYVYFIYRFFFEILEWNKWMKSKKGKKSFDVTSIKIKYIKVNVLHTSLSSIGVHVRKQFF